MNKKLLALCAVGLVVVPLSVTLTAIFISRTLNISSDPSTATAGANRTPASSSSRVVAKVPPTRSQQATQQTGPLRYDPEIEPKTVSIRISGQSRDTPIETVIGSQLVFLSRVYLNGMDYNLLHARYPLAEYILVSEAAQQLSKPYIAEGPFVPIQQLYYIVESAGNVVAYFEIKINFSGETSYVGGNKNGVGLNSKAAAIAQSLDEIVALKQPLSGVYEPRLINFGGVDLGGPDNVLWLKSIGGGGDLIYPVGISRYGLKLKTLYSVDEFLATIMPAMTK